MREADLGPAVTSRRASRSTRALLDAIFPDDPADRSRSGAGNVVGDVQSLLGDAVRRLVSRTAATSAGAWLLREDGEPMAAAGHRREGSLTSIDRETFARLCRLSRATDLGDPGLDPALRKLAHRSGLTAAVAVRGAEESAHPLVALLLGGPDDPPGRVRPRTLAALEEIGGSLQTPLAAAGAVSRLGRLDAAVRRLDRLAALGDLTTEIVHEVRNPLVSVKTFLQLLPDRLDDPEFHDGFRRVVNDEVARLERLIDTVLSHARPDPARDSRAVADVAEAFDSITHLLTHRARERRLAIRQAVGPRVAAVAMSPDSLRQVLLNLTLNALDATPPGGRISLGAEARAHSEGRLVELTVDDEGGGVSGEERERIFQVFHSTRADQPGGLGLAISRRLVEEAGGSIDVAEAPGGGARFRLRLRGCPPPG